MKKEDREKILNLFDALFTYRYPFTGKFDFGNSIVDIIFYYDENNNLIEVTYEFKKKEKSFYDKLKSKIKFWDEV